MLERNGANMKNSLKFILFLFLIVTLCAIVTVSALADNTEVEDKPADGYYFEIYDPQKNELKKYTDPTLFASAAVNAPSGSTVRLLWDIQVDYLVRGDGGSGWMEFTGGTSSKPKTYNLDLNGRFFSFVRCRSKGYAVSMNVGAYTTLNVYSSKENGRLYNYHTENASGANALIWLRNNGATLNFGEATVSELTYKSVTKTKSETGYDVFTVEVESINTVTHPGSNFSAYGSALIGIVDNGTNDKNVKVNISGGTYCQIGSADALINYTSNEEESSKLTVKNATLISDDSKNVFKSNTAATGSVSFDSCVLYSKTNIISSSSPNIELSFNNCSFIGTLGSISSPASFSECRFTVEPSFTDGTVIAKLYEESEIILPSHRFTYNESGYVNVSSYNTIPTSEAVLFSSATANDGEWANITWDAESILGEGEKITDKWFIGQIPYSPFKLPDRTAVYKYSYPETKPVTGNATYTLEARANFAVKSNLNLSSKLTYNVYVPYNVYSKILSIKLNGKELTPTLTTLESNKYYAFSYDVSVSQPDENIVAEFAIRGYGSHVFTDVFTFSIPAYMEKVLDSQPTKEARDLVNATRDYINAYYNYSIGTAEKPVTVTASQYSGLAYDTASVKEVVTSAALILDNSVRFIFELNGNASNKIAEFIIKTDASNKSFTAIEDDFKKGYFIIELPASQLTKDILIKAKNDSGDEISATYNIDSYIHSVHTLMESNTNLRVLVNAISAYGKAAAQYAKTGGNGTPEVSFKIGDTVLNGSNYAVSAESDREKEAARALISALKKATGIELKFTDEADEYTHTISFTTTSPHPMYDFMVSVDSDNLILAYCYPSFAVKGTEYFIDDYILSANGNEEFDFEFLKTYTANELYYSDFGAVGDGVTDDFFAIKATHDAANKLDRYTVRADSGKTYYIHETRPGNELIGYGAAQTISIKTNVNWGNANFIIDDTDLSCVDGTGRTGKNIFTVVRDTPVTKISDREILDAVLEAGLGRTTKVIDLGLNRDVMIIPYNSAHKVYRRKGYGGFLGGTMHEVILIDRDGNISDETPMMFDYANLDYIEVHSLDDTRLTIEGGTFTTRASHVDIVYYDENNVKGVNDGYISRGMSVQRSYTTVRNVKHYVTGEITLAEQKAGMLGHAYNGFFSASSANMVTFENCVLTGKRCYTKSTAGLSGGTTGTYDFSANTVNKIVLKNCTQSNFWITVAEDGTITNATENTPGVQLSMATSTLTKAKMHWGIGGTNYCKNMEYINSTLSRFDAHSGLYNGKIIDSTVNYIAITGVGDMIIENSRWFAEGPSYNSNSLIHLRSDYGSTWEGTVKIKNVKSYVFTTYDVSLAMHTYSNWYFGYQACFPSLDITNLDFYNINTREPLPAGYEIKLCRTSVTAEPALHLSETKNTAPFYPDVDNDKDGFVDETEIPYDDVVARDGIKVGTSRVNLNPIKPPEFIKIIQNDGVNRKGGYVYVVPDTSVYGASDGGYYDNVETNGGFFGDTKFYYGRFSNDYYLGTKHVGEDTETFVFR